MNRQSSRRGKKPTAATVRVPTQPVRTQYVYHWDRIVGALTVLVLVIGLVGFGLHAWLFSPPTVPPVDRAIELVDAPILPPFPADPRPENLAPENLSPEDLHDIAWPEFIASPDAEFGQPIATPADEGGPATLETAVIPGEGGERVFLPPGTRVNLRAAPSLSSAVLQIVDERAELWFLEAGDAFYRVRTEAGIIGWVSRDYSSLEPYPES